MIASRFRSVVLSACVAGAALGCYMVSLKVASERNALARVERHIDQEQADIRALRTEIATRGRLDQLERWNSDVLGLAAPKAAQYLHSEVQLATFTRPVAPAADAHLIPVSAPLDAPKAAPAAVVTVSYRAPARPRPAAAVAAADPDPVSELPLVHRASYEKPAAEARPQRMALLDDAVLTDLGRLARREQQAAKARR